VNGHWKSGVVLLRRVRIAAVTFIAASMSCTSSTEPGCGNVSVQVTPGTRPTVAWTPSCAARVVRIVDVVASAYYNIEVPAWEISAAPNLVRSPVSFGVASSGTVMVPSAPADLVVGRPYVAYVSIGDTDGSIVRRGVSFTVK
jgi:hypothetical protein